MWKNLGLYLFLFFFVGSFCSSVAQQTELTTTLVTTSSTIKDKLQSLKNESDNMIFQLHELSQELQLSESQRKDQEVQLMTLSDSLMSINQQLTRSFENITRLEAKLHLKNKILSVLIAVLVLRTICMFAGFVLYIKGIKLPRWLDILL